MRSTGATLELKTEDFSSHEEPKNHVRVGFEAHGRRFPIIAGGS